MMEKILPIGSIVTLKQGKQKLMIINRVPLYNNKGTIGYFDYAACVYPVGQTDQQIYFFNEEDIKEVCFEGYRDESEEAYCIAYRDNIGHVKYPRLHLEFEGNLDAPQ